MSVRASLGVDRVPDNWDVINAERRFAQIRAQNRENNFLRGILGEAATPRTESYSLLAQVARGGEENRGAVVMKLVPLVVGKDTSALLTVPEDLKREMEELKRPEGEPSNYSAELIQFLEQKFVLYLTKAKIEAMLTCTDFRALAVRDREAYLSLSKKLSDLGQGGGTIVFDEGFSVPEWTEEKEQELREANPDLEFLPFPGREINFRLLGPGSF